MKVNGIDENDNQIIDILSKDARASYSDIGSRIGLSRTAVKNRIQRLEEDGIIVGYKAVIKSREASETMAFLVNIETSPEAFEVVKELFKAADETVTLFQTTGKCHLTAVCLSKDMNSMRAFVTGMYKASEGISYINVNAIMDVVKGGIVPE